MPACCFGVYINRDFGVRSGFSLVLVSHFGVRPAVAFVLCLLPGETVGQQARQAVRGPTHSGWPHAQPG